MISRLVTFVRELVQRRRANREVDEELEFHLAMETDANVARGMSPADARRRALADLGGVTQTRESVRAVRASWLDSAVQDLRFAWRSLRHGGWSGAAAVAMLAVGIGITAAMFTIMDALLLRPVPFDDPDRLAYVYMGNERGGRTTVSPAVLREWRSSGAFEYAEGANRASATIDVQGVLAVRTVADVTPAMFEMLGSVHPLRGRLFTAADGAPGSQDRILISEEVWSGLLGRDPGVIGRTVLIDRVPAVVVGVMPAHFRFPSAATAIWRAAQFEGAAAPRPTAYVRFRSDLPRDDAESRATRVAHLADPATATSKLVLRSQPLVTPADPYTRRAIPMLVGGVVLVFVILCANVTNLLLGRLTARTREFALRSALGASRVRLFRQALAESGLIGVLAIIAGLGLAWALVAGARAVLPDAFLLRTLNPLDLDARAVISTSVVGALATLLAGVLPALIGSRVAAAGPVTAADRGGTQTRSARLLTRGLLIGELALACTILVATMVLVRSFVNLTSASRGLDVEGVVVASLTLPPAAQGDAVARDTIGGALRAAAASLPAVHQVAWSYGNPPEGGVQHEAMEWRSDVPGGTGVSLKVDQHIVDEQFFALYRVPLVRGRTFGPADTSSDVIVSEGMAAALWPGLDPLGRTLAPADKPGALRVIGVAREIHHPRLAEGPPAVELYSRFAGGWWTTMAMASMRCAGPCPDAAVIRERLAEAYAGVRVTGVRPVETWYLEELARPRASATLALTFTVVAVVAAAGGLYSVLSYAVGRRRREFGIRSALGASSAQLAGVVVREGLAVSMAGLTIGAAGAWWLSRTLTSLQYGVTTGDPLSIAMVAAVLVGTVAAASWWPARQAMRANPVELLRHD